MPIVNCKICKQEFYTKPSWLKNGYGKYCSQKCNHESQKNGKVFECFICKTQTYKSLKDQNKSKSGNFFCSKTCQTIWRNTTYIGDKHANWTSGEFSYKQILLRSGNKVLCNKCKSVDKRVLAVHHKDRNRQNNSVSNLVWLCHNCHFLVHHYKNEAGRFLVPVA